MAPTKVRVERRGRERESEGRDGYGLTYHRREERREEERGRERERENQRGSEDGRAQALIWALDTGPARPGPAPLARPAIDGP